MSEPFTKENETITFRKETEINPYIGRLIFWSLNLYVLSCVVTATTMLWSVDMAKATKDSLSLWSSSSLLFLLLRQGLSQSLWLSLDFSVLWSRFFFQMRVCVSFFETLISWKCPVALINQNLSQGFFERFVQWVDSIWKSFSLWLFSFQTFWVEWMQLFCMENAIYTMEKEICCRHFIASSAGTNF